jgi:uncharacterized protein involved in exopolysaccharide biosynthesis
LVRGWKVVFGLVFASAVAGVVIALVLPPTYTASTTFLPAVGSGSRTLAGGFAGLASQLGLSLGGENTFSPDFFAEVLTSRELLRSVVLSEFDDPVMGQGSVRKPLLDILMAEGTTEEERVSDGIRGLAASVSQRVNRRTGIVTLSVSGPSAVLAADVANLMIELLNGFNLERLQSQSRQRRRFAGERLAEADEQLREAEAQHLRFLQTNRRLDDSPLLRFEENRLARQVQLRQEVVQTLTREFEEARIAEVRDTPLLTVIDRAVPPDRRSAPRRRLIAMLATFAGGLAALAWVSLDAYRRAADQVGAASYRMVLDAWRETRAELGRAIGLRGPR